MAVQASEAFVKRNINCTIDESIDRFMEISEAAAASGKSASDQDIPAVRKANAATAVAPSSPRPVAEAGSSVLTDLDVEDEEQIR